MRCPVAACLQHRASPEVVLSLSQELLSSCVLTYLTAHYDPTRRPSPLQKTRGPGKHGGDRAGIRAEEPALQPVLGTYALLLLSKFRVVSPPAENHSYKVCF